MIIEKYYSLNYTYTFLFDGENWYVDTGKRKALFHGGLSELEAKFGTLFFIERIENVES